MSGDDSVLNFPCAGEFLLGVLSAPARPAEIGVVIVVGGPQYRVGSHRQFVQLARRLAAEGHATLRFDCRGMGDSTGELKGFEQIGPDIAAAIDALIGACPSVKQVVLWGLCDGASAALMYMDGPAPDRRVAGLCLVNPWARTEATLAQTHLKHYYLRRLAQRDFWTKLLSGGVAVRAAREFGRNLSLGLRQSRADPSRRDADAPYTLRMARTWRHYKGPLLLVISGRDLTAQEFLLTLRSSPDWRGALERHDLQRLDLPDSDHTLSDNGGREQMEGQMLKWLATAIAGARPNSGESRHAAQEDVHVA